MINLSEDDKAILWLVCVEALSYKERVDLIDMYDSPRQLRKEFAFNKAVADYVGNDKYQVMLSTCGDEYINNIVNNLCNQNIDVITYMSDYYPKDLLDIPSYPLILFCKGNLELFKTKCIAIVGTRRITRYGIDVTTMFARDLALTGFTIVSGMAEGVDTVAHEATLKCGGNTIAVLGAGFNNIYPVSNEGLYNRILQNNGLVVTEYLPSVPPLNYNFPIRNRIIVGLSVGVLITEATEKSGTMHSKNYAVDFNKDLYVVPGRITDIYSKGCNNIIKTCQGAIVTCPDDIKSQYNIVYEHHDKVQSNTQYSMDESIIISALQGHERSFDDLIVQTEFDVKKLTTLLMKLTIKGSIKKLSGGMYSL